MSATALALDSTLGADNRLEQLAHELAERQANEAVASLSDDELDRRVQQTGEVVREMIGLRAKSLSGLRSKARAALWASGGEEAWREHHAVEPGAIYDQVLHSIVDDLVAVPSAAIHSFTGRPGVTVPSAVPPEEELQSVANGSELARTVADFVALRAETDRLMALELDLVDRASALYPEPLADHVQFGTNLSRPTRTHLDTTQGTALAPNERWKKIEETLDRDLGLPQVQTAWKAAMTAQDAVAVRIAEMEPKNIRDAALKHGVLLAAHLTEEGDVMDPDVFLTAMKRFQLDLEALAKSTEN